MITLKTYADKGIQTGSLQPSSGTCSNGFSPVFSQHHVPCTHELLDASSLLGSPPLSHFPDDSSAYIRSELSSNHSPRYLSDRPAGDRRSQKYGHLGHGKPIHLPMANDRTVSLPETSPSHRLAQEQTVRLVSMPDNLKGLRYTLDHSNHAGYLDASMSSNGSTRTRSSDTEHGFPGGSLLTPSPPSSPESVMIIGNESRVPQTFLRPKLAADDIAHGGSPPRPIPALHGPLSLPYARCPSGAEGTVIEGEDLTHMIWGLDSHDSQVAQTRSHPPAAQAYKLPQSDSYPRNIKQPTFAPDQVTVPPSLYNEDVIDLSRPEFQVPLSSRLCTTLPSKQLFTTTDGTQSSRKDLRGKTDNPYEFVRVDSPIQLYPSSLGLLPSEASSWNAGLGIDLWQSSLESNSLLSFDPAYSSYDKETPMISGRSRGPLRPTRIYQTPRAVSGSNLPPFEPHGFRQRIITPPDTGSPEWSPRFQQTSLASTNPEVQLEHQTPILDYIDIPRIQTHNISRDSLVSSQSSETSISMRPDYRSTTMVASIDPEEGYDSAQTYRTPDSAITDGSSSSHSDGCLSFRARITPQQQDAKFVPTPLSPVSPELRRSLSQKQPRSIPLARLIQRRLSSVIEEDADAETVAAEVCRPPTTSMNPGTNAGRVSRRPLVQGKEKKPVPTTGPPTGPSSEQAKRAYRPPGHPSRQNSISAQNMPVRVSKTPSMDLPTTPTNRFGENKGNDGQKHHIKPKKTTRKKKYAKKPETGSAANKET